MRIVIIISSFILLVVPSTYAIDISSVGLIPGPSGATPDDIEVHILDPGVNNKVTILGIDNKQELTPRFKLKKELDRMLQEKRILDKFV